MAILSFQPGHIASDAKRHKIVDLAKSEEYVTPLLMNEQ